MLSGGCLAALKPTLQRRLTFTGRTAQDNASHAQVLIEIGPVYAFAACNQPPVVSLSGTPVEEPRVPHRGTETVRPSDRSTAKESSVNVTLSAFTACILRLKELIPTPQQIIHVLVNKFADAV